MGVYSCASENSFESATTKLNNLKDDDNHNPVESIGSEERKVMADDILTPSNYPVLDPSSPKHEAAIKLQKVYKSFRTRRKLADCAVLIEQSWWKLLDFAELKHSSISFFDIDRHETAISRWSRARTRAAKVGKGLSKNAKAQKLALQHWLEAIDPRHRYGHNLHLYYVKWLNSQSKEPFFYWLDIGEGKDINLIEKCPRSKLLQQCIKYLGPMERTAYEVVIEGGKLLYKKTRELLNTTKEYKGSKWIFVLSTAKTLYVGKKKRGTFQHSSFLSGGATLAAGRIVAENGILKAVWPHSGHYKPTPENFQDFISFLRENSLDLNDVKLDPIVDEEEGLYLRSNASEDDLAETNLSQSRSFSRGKLTALEIPCKYTLLEKMMRENRREDDFPPGSPTDELDETVPEECISQRISQHKETNSFQLGKQLSCNWTTGAGPRIGCLRDYPSQLQSHALEEVNLSPRSALRLRLAESRRSSSNLSCRTTLLTTSPIHSLTSC